MEKWNDCVNGWLFSDRKETRKGKGGGESREEEAWVRGKWMRQEETRECDEVGGWKQRKRN